MEADVSDKIPAVILFALFGLLSLIIGVVILVKKEYFSTRLRYKDFLLAPTPIWKVSGKRAKSEGIGSIVVGLVFLGLALAIYLWGN